MRREATLAFALWLAAFAAPAQPARDEPSYAVPGRGSDLRVAGAARE